MTQPAPLAGLKVLEVAQFAAGPFPALLLADFGADVVKIEPPGGDGFRNWPPQVDSGGGEPYGISFAVLNRNKRSVVLDLKNAGDRARFLLLCAKADVLVENNRPGAMERLGLGFADVCRVQPKIVYCSVTGYGQTGPYAKRGAFDVAVQAVSGCMSVTGEEDGPPAKCGVPVADFMAGVYAAFGIMVALQDARRTGKARHVDCSMLACMMQAASLQFGELWGTGSPPKRLGSRHPRNAPYRGARTRSRRSPPCCSRSSGSARLPNGSRFSKRAACPARPSMTMRKFARTFTSSKAASCAPSCCREGPRPCRSAIRCG